MGRGPRSFDPVKVGHAETRAWASYYLRDWPGVLRAAHDLVHEGFGLGRRHTLVGAWHVLRANQAWAPYPDNDPVAATESMRRFYSLLVGTLPLQPEQAAELEVRWWDLHRRRQREQAVSRPDLVASLVDLITHVYGISGAAAEPAADWRVEAMDLSDAWVAQGADPASPLLAAERRALVACYAELLDALARVPA